MLVALYSLEHKPLAASVAASVNFAERVRLRAVMHEVIVRCLLVLRPNGDHGACLAYDSHNGSLEQA